jgi:cbb3-type cytochrome oxidase maturation protein
MESLYLLIPISLVFIGIATWIFFWAVNSGQYEDLDSEAQRILFDQEDHQDALTDEHKHDREESL